MKEILKEKLKDWLIQEDMLFIILAFSLASLSIGTIVIIFMLGISAIVGGVQ